MTAKLRKPDGSGPPFVRRVILSRPDPGSVTASIEDHVHHFEVEIAHRDGRVTSIAGRAVRAPWSMCPRAVEELHVFVGLAVGTRPQLHDRGAQCMHLHELASTAIRFAGTPTPERRYDLTVTGWDTDTTTSSASRDGQRILTWRVRDGKILEPEPFRGQRVAAGFTAWLDEHVGGDTAEVALLLRRATWMGPTSGFDLDQFDSLDQIGMPSGSCYATQPIRVSLARRNRGSSYAPGTLEP